MNEEEAVSSVCKIVQAGEEADLGQMVVVEVERNRWVPVHRSHRPEDFLDHRCELAIVSKLTSGFRFEEYGEQYNHLLS